MSPNRSRTILGIGLLFVLALFVCVLLWDVLKSNVLEPLLVRLPPSVVPIVLPIVKPIPLPYELLHDDKALREIVRPVPKVVTVSPVACDGDGMSGARVQLIYAHASDVEDRYSLFVTAFQQYAAEIDDMFLFSAAETGGMRRIRWVHDAACFPTVLDVVLSVTGDDLLANTINELRNLGYQSPDRNYAVFVDAHVYCGISAVQFDDRPDPTLNLNNLGPHYARVDNGCWDAIPMGHEIMHLLGAVQISAPHSSGEWHCWDADDLMCRPTNGTPTQLLCPWSGYYRFDCNNDDYFSTNPPVGSYLETHWNTANSRYLIGAAPIVPTPTPCVRGNSGKPCR